MSLEGVFRIGFGSRCFLDAAAGETPVCRDEAELGAVVGAND